jgi:hypothetical protein
VAFGAYLTRQLATLLNTSDFLRVRTSGHRAYHRHDDHTSCGCNIDQLHCDLSVARVNKPYHASLSHTLMALF